ncbi:hypothetical protein E1Z16_12065 [Listeria monocytogenes]|uniref:Uncharacterized protein n=3 Tax=Listeria TaxID=1637 RepID=A0A463CSG3_LISMN|nr:MULTISPECIES: hypothetical protein [Listeria]EAF3065123.1 hypothetical protein [Listeria monocytogenes serotype 1/2a]EAG6254479.1 hypothetical protein [Listeria monocytogenes CFSAN003806]ECR3484336.1 hypothetical protein [Listeria innocua]ARJ79042.1 hypothetical protein UL92_12095 [Listeria monocytogenes]AZU54174.1 Hypothetical protein FORC57_2333 [Listeria monocytogenes]
MMSMNLRDLVDDNENYMTHDEAEKMFIQAGYILIPKSNFNISYTSKDNSKLPNDKTKEKYSYTSDIDKSNKKIKSNVNTKAA